MTASQIQAMHASRERREGELGQDCCLYKDCYREPAQGEYCEKHQHLAAKCAHCGEPIGPNDVTSAGCCYPCICDIEDGLA